MASGEFTNVCSPTFQDFHIDWRSIVAWQVIVSLKQGILREVLSRFLASRTDILLIERPWIDSDASVHEFEMSLLLRSLLNRQSSEWPFRNEHRVARYFRGASEEALGIVVVVTNIDSSVRIPAEVSRWLTEFPEVVIVGVHWESARVQTFRQVIEVHESGDSLSEIVVALETCLNVHTGENRI